MPCYFFVYFHYVIFSKDELKRLKNTVAEYDRDSLIKSFEEIISFYKDLRKEVFLNDINFQTRTEKKSLQYLSEIKKRK